MLDAATVESIAAAFAEAGPSEQALAQLRASHPEIHFTYCLDDDVGVMQPYAAKPGFNVYLVDGRDHCMKFTSDLAHATGLVLAEVIDDD